LKSISISLYNRPEYTARLFDHLNNCIGVDEYSFIICVEPVNSDVINLAKSFRPAQSSLTINEDKLGCQTNIFQSVAKGFEINTGFHIHLEDDTIPGKDCLKYFEWAAEKYKDDQSVFSVSGYVNSNNLMENCCNSKTDDIMLVDRRKHFTPWGWGTWLSRWKEIRKDWDFGYNNGGWDVNMAKRLRQDRYEIYPMVSRIQNIGAKDGIHVESEEWHKKNHFNEYWIESMNKYTEDFYER
jgi:hypothetical protein